MTPTHVTVDPLGLYLCLSVTFCSTPSCDSVNMIVTSLYMYVVVLVCSQNSLMCDFQMNCTRRQKCLSSHSEKYSNKSHTMICVDTTYVCCVATVSFHVQLFIIIQLSLGMCIYCTHAVRKVIHYSVEMEGLGVERVGEKMRLCEKLGDLCCSESLKAFPAAVKFYGQQVCVYRMVVFTTFTQV